MAERFAVVTGAGSGIGRAVALELLANGWRVALAGRREAPLVETARLGGAPERALPLPADVTDPASVEALFARIRDSFGRLDLLFNNAGISLPATSIGDLAPEDWDRAVAVNLTGMFLCARGAFRLMRAQQPQGGRIINNGSVSAQVPRPGSAAYTATKHAVTGLTKSIALDGRALSIVCGQIDIGNVATAMTERMAAGVPQADGSVAAEPTMALENVQRTVLLMAQMPLDANIPFVTVMAARMPLMGRG